MTQFALECVKGSYCDCVGSIWSGLQIVKCVRVLQLVRPLFPLPYFRGLVDPALKTGWTW